MAESNTKTGIKNGEVSKSLEMPSVTRLLNRKKLGVSTPSRPAPVIPPAVKSSPPTLPPPAQVAPPQPEPKTPPAPEASEPGSSISLVMDENPPAYEIQSSGSPNNVPPPLSDPDVTADVVLPETAELLAAPPENRTSIEIPELAPLDEGYQVRPGSLRSTHIEALAHWDLATLKDTEIAQKLLKALIERGVHGAFFLSNTGGSGSAASFVSSAAFTSSWSPARVRLWTGARWNPSIAPDLWNAFTRKGFSELKPPSENTSSTKATKNSRLIVRKAFGVKLDETLFLIRCGSASSCKGVLAVFAPDSAREKLAADIPALIAA